MADFLVIFPFSHFFLRHPLHLFLCLKLSWIAMTNLHIIECFLCYAQLLWLAKSEPEPFLQPLLNHDGNVATKHLGDLRESDNYLRQPGLGADEAEVPELNGRTGADNVSHWGQAKLLLFLSFISSGPSRLQCLWEGHHHCEHLLWRINRARWHHYQNPISK